MSGNGKEIVKRMDSLLKERNIKRQALAEFAGIATNTISTWSARNNVPAADVAIKIAKYLGVSVEWLINGEDPDGLSVDERNLLNNWKDIPEDSGKDVIRTLIQTTAEKARSENERIPV